MASNKKQRRTDSEMCSDDSDTNMDENGTNNEMEIIQVDFDVVMPEESDFHGIKNLLQQLFLKAHVNLTELTEILIKQNKLTGIIKQADDGDFGEDEDMEDIDVNFGVFSVINLTERRNLDFVKEIKTYLLSHAKKTCQDSQFQELRRIFEDVDQHVGLIISERMVNIPPKIAVPLYNGLSDDLRKAVAKGQAFDFKYYVLICKILIFEDSSKKQSVIYTNAEEEIIAEEAIMTFDFSVSDEVDSGLSGAWTDDDNAGHRKRRVLLFPASKYDTVCAKLTAELDVA